MQIAVQDLEYDTDPVEDVHANYEYIDPIDLHPDELEDDEWVNSTCIEHITSEFNRSSTPIGTEDLKVRDIFKSKVKLLQAITKWFI